MQMIVLDSKLAVMEGASPSLENCTCPAACICTCRYVLQLTWVVAKSEGRLKRGPRLGAKLWNMSSASFFWAAP